MTTPHDELDLLAFRFIADELSDGEREAFELRLADDQSAREAVARAVELSQATMLAFESAAFESMEPVTAAPAGLAPKDAAFSSWYTRILWMASGAAACLVGLIGYQMANQPGTAPSDPNPTLAAPTDEMARLAGAWSDAQESLRAARAAAELASAGAIDDETNAFIHSEIASTSLPDIHDTGETPSWVLAAVGAEPDGDEGERMDDGPSDHTN